MPDLETSLAKSHISKGRPFLNTDGSSTVVRGMHIMHKELIQEKPTISFPELKLSVKNEEKAMHQKDKLKKIGYMP